MSSFSTAWLALREAADREARNAEVLAACKAAFAGRESLAVCDLGAGSGASVRALAALLPPRQTWLLVDDDEANLEAARQLGGPGLKVTTLRHDLAPAPRCWPEGTGLVTASAFFDLVSESWIERFVAALTADRLPLLATLTFDGAIALEPAHPLDGTVAAAFREHQGRDKGFGPAVGPDATGVLADYLSMAGYAVTEGESPWRLGGAWLKLRRALTAGIADAVAETGAMSGPDLVAWSTAALQPRRTLVVGHRDLFAAPRPE